MSAFFVSKEDIDVLVSAIIDFKVYVQLPISHRPRQLDHDQGDDLGKMLWAENVKSLNERYRLATSEGPELESYTRQVEAYRWTERCGLKPGAVAKISHCYSYQSCEHEGWNESPACKAMEALEHTLVRHLPGYEAAPWGISDPKADLPLVCAPGMISLMSMVRR